MTAANRPGAVFDCNVLIQAAARPNGPAAACLRLLDESRITLYISHATIGELRAVFEYPTVREAFPDLTDAHVTSFLDRLAYKAQFVRRVRHMFDYPRAPQDEPYIDLAATAKADFLVSRDKDLLSLMSGHTLLCKQFRQKTHPLEILCPVDFLRAIGVAKRSIPR